MIDSSLSPEVSAAIAWLRTCPDWQTAPKYNDVADLLLRVERERIRLEQQVQQLTDGLLLPVWVCHDCDKWWMLERDTCECGSKLSAGKFRLASGSGQTEP